MVQKENLSKLFYYLDGQLYGKYFEGRRKESNTRVVGKVLGTVIKGGYRQVTFTHEGVRYKELVHRVIWALHYDCWPELLDHIDRDPTNNKIENLRVANKKFNSINSGVPKNNVSGVKGVCWHKQANKWTAQIKNDQKKVHLGTFEDLQDAVSARLQAEKRLWCDI